MFELKNCGVDVKIDDKTGYITEIRGEADNYKANLIINDNRGLVEGFKPCSSVQQTEDSIISQYDCERKHIVLNVERKLVGGVLVENYEFHNFGARSSFIKEGEFGIHFPYKCNVDDDFGMQEDTHDFFTKRVNAHVWCGDNICWIFTEKLSGEPPYFVTTLTNGGIKNYSISAEKSYSSITTNYRGDIVLNPAPIEIPPQESVFLSFSSCYTDDVEKTLLSHNGFILLKADKYSVECGETITFSAKCAEKAENIIVRNGDEMIKAEVKGKIAEWKIAFETLGEKRIDVSVNGKSTYIRVNVILPIDEILQRRARFIVEKQQYNKPGALNGAYLIYDDKTKSQYYDDWFCDHNASRERIAIGITVLKALQKKFDVDLIESITKHREFVERELCDITTGAVFNEVGKYDAEVRIYNYPWFSVYYLEWFILTKEVKYLEISAKILLEYYRLSDYSQDSQCIEAVEVLDRLKNNGLSLLFNELKTQFLTHCNDILKRNFNGFSHEVGYVMEKPCCIACYLSQAYILTKEEKYIKNARIAIRMMESYVGNQPDYHMNGIAIRYWDRFWFGKKQQHGDLFPHYWSSLIGWSYKWYERASGEDKRAKYENILKNNLCVYREDGFASNNYLYPFSVTVYSDEEKKAGSKWNEKKYYGENYDEWTNDQDWALYYAVKLL